MSITILFLPVLSIRATVISAAVNFAVSLTFSQLLSPQGKQKCFQGYVLGEILSIDWLVSHKRQVDKLIP